MLFPVISWELTPYPTIFYDSALLPNLDGEGSIFSTMGENFDVDSPGLVIKMQKSEENRWKKFRRSFFKTMS